MNQSLLSSPVLQRCPPLLTDLLRSHSRRRLRSPGERPALRVVGGTAGRGERYYQSAQPTPVHRIGPEGLDVLKRIQSAGEVAELILVFGPHAGETLGQV